MSSTKEKGGYNVEFVGNEPINVTCSICLFVLREPMQAEECGHRFCKSCIEDLKEKSENECITCPQDRTVNKVFRDRGKEREILDYLIKCTNISNGCQWTGELRELEKHREICEYLLVSCGNKGCQKEVQRKQLLQHMNADCSLRNVNCEFCKTVVKFRGLEKHKKVCEKRPIECKRCKIKDVPKHLMNDHLKNECPIIDCEYSDIGCKETAKRECMSLHKENSTEVHLDCVISKLREHEKIFQKQEKQFKTQLQNKEKQLQKQRNELDRQAVTIKKQTETLKEQQSTITALQMQMSEVLGKLDITTFSQHSQQQSVTSIELPQDEQKLKTVSVDRSQEVQKREVSANEERTLQDLKELKEQVGRLDNLQSVEVFKNGLVWVIDNFKQNFKYGKFANDVYFHTIFTQKGYKCKVFFYLNGSADTKGTHMSLYFGLEEGPFDDALIWPMNATISFCVLKNGLEENKFSFSTTSSKEIEQYFNRPQTMVNQWGAKVKNNSQWGCLQFIPHNSISNFIVNNTLTLKISVQ